MGLLGDIFSAGNTAKRRLRGLLDDPIGSMQQAVDNAFPTRYEAQNAISQLRGQQYNPDALQAYNTKLDSAAMNFAPMGITVWHGSPHKFSKFDMSKIGTGEGAQAYGHGLYMAEAPEVARAYSADRAYVGKVMDGKTHNVNFDSPQWIAQNAADEMGSVEQAISHLGKVLNQRRGLKAAGQAESNAQVQSAIDLLKNGQVSARGTLYKVDVPDEAVSRMLDWDKPLSQQAPEVQKALKSIGVEIDDGVSIYQGPKGKWIADNGQKMSIFNSESEALQSVPPISGKDIWNRLKSTIPLDKSDALKTAGIPGIRYLDGGSRSAGQGSSNFVLFDDQLPRILETNGVPTGQVPWKPGEWGGLLGGR